MSNAHEDGLEIFQTRWALSYFRGPLTRDQIKKLMAQVKALPDFLTNCTKSDVKEIVSKNTINKDQLSGNNIVNHERKQPTLHPEITQYFIPVSDIETKNKLSEFYYRPVILGAASLNFVNSKLDIDTIKDLTVITPIVDDPISVDWRNSQEIDIDIKKPPTKT